MFWCRGPRWALIVGCVVGVVLGVPDVASAGTYVMRSCNVPTQARQTAGPWHVNIGGGTFANDDCATGGGFGLNAGPMAPGATSVVVLESGPQIAIRRVKLWLIARLAGTGSSIFAAVQYASATAATPGIGLFGPPGGETLTSPYVSPPLPPDTALFQVVLTCSADAGTGCTPNSTDVLDIRGAEVTLEENTPPTGSITGGELMSGATQSGVRALAYSANDLHSGVARVAAIAGKTEVGTVDFTSGCAFADLAACVRARNGSISVDTRKLADGIYPVSLRVTDAAGNEQTVQAATAIQVVNGVAASTVQPSASGTAGGALLTAEFAANRRSTLTVGYGRGAVVRGRLVGAGGRGIAGASVAVEQRPTPGGARVVRSTLVTEQDGAFALTVPRGATSRILRFVYSADRGDPPLTQRLRLRVKASASLRVALKGVVVRYSGQVRSKPLPRNGKVVEIQGRAPGAAWKTFARKRTDRRGDFTGTYRLRVHRPGVRLQFRVRIPADSGYPFVAHTGRPVTRTVR
jgi:hypothetical protein